MLVIRKEQQEALKEYMLGQYEDRTYEHFQKFFQKYCEILTEEVMRSLIRHGVKKAEEHNIVGERNVCLYTTLMLVLGSSFDEDPQYPWAVRMLKDDSLTDESERTDQLFDTATDFLDRSAGEDYERHGAALARVRALSLEKALADRADLRFDERLYQLMQQVYPAKVEAVGRAALGRLLMSGRKAAAGHGFRTDYGQTVYIGLMFLLGGGFDTDPQYPWIGEILNDPDLPDGDARAGRLYEAAMKYLDQWLV